MVISSWTPVTAEDVCSHSERAAGGSIFVCIKGTAQDGCTYLEEVWRRGCRCFVVDRRSCIEKLKGISDAAEQACVVLVADCRKAYALLCRNLFDKPDEKLCMIGITGTKGKTTVASFIYQELCAAGIAAGQMGTCGARWKAHQEQLLCTTPDARVLYELLSRMEQDGVTHVVMEVSSQALKQKRVSGIIYEAGVFTNLYPDHISDTEHADMEEYYYWKSQLFEVCRSAVIPHPASSQAAARLYNTYKARMPVYFADAEQDSQEEQDSHRLCTLAEPVSYTRHAQRPVQQLRLKLASGTEVRHVLEMPGTFQICNDLFAVTVLCALKLPVREYMHLKPVSGRMECICVCRGACFYVDYAHNAEALQEALMSLRCFDPNRLICVFGCGGNRSRLRRGPMGRVSTTYADYTIITEDNSRNEKFPDICRDIVGGIEPEHRAFEIIEDRALAIKRAVELSEPGDIVIIAGKGHEDYMEKNGERIAFSDAKEVKKYVRICKYHH
jgi:UDP-N-acetylmuramoyl-L-alanyl-D-glutamate--2,6-diaminopimelate ligase